MLIFELFHWNFSLYILCNEDSVLWYKVNSHQWFVPSQFPCHGSTYSLLGKTLQSGCLMTTTMLSVGAGLVGLLSYVTSFTKVGFEALGLIFCKFFPKFSFHRIENQI